MRIFSFYLAAIFCVSLSCFHEVNARLHKHELDTNKRIFRRFVDLSSISNMLGANGLTNLGQPQGSPAPAGAGYSAPPPGGSPPPAAQPAAPLLPATITPPNLITAPKLPAPAAPALPPFPKNFLPPLALPAPGSDELNLPDLGGVLGAPQED